MFRNKKLVIFGASTGAKKVSDTLKSLSIEIDYFSDNNSNIWGEKFQGIEIIEPKKIMDISCYIIIASMYYTEIYVQLLELGIDKTCIIPKEEIFIDYFDKYNLTISSKLNEKETIILDVAEGYQLSGAVRWTLNLAEILLNNKKEFLLFAKDDLYKDRINEKYMQKQVLFQMEYENYLESVRDVVNKMSERMPCTVIVNTISQNFMAAYILKKKYPEYVRIISVIHSDFQKFYDSNIFLGKWIDKYICVSEKVAKTMKQKSKIDPDKIIFRNSPVMLQTSYKKEYPDGKRCVQIAYAARLEKAQKRADLLLKVIGLLEEKQVEYQINIAGDGNYKSKIEDYITEHQLQRKVHLLGMLEYDQMDEFWRNSDIFINVSDCEGMSLSMLEAMSYGLAPVVTNTSGVENMIQNHVNGIVSKIFDMEEMSEHIVWLINNFHKIREYGEKSKIQIEKICNGNQYMEDILK